MSSVTIIPQFAPPPQVLFYEVKSDGCTIIFNLKVMIKKYYITIKNDSS